ncbi:MAG: phosphotransferase [Gammaproteobacteria bacterium]|nr:phosphotransferase [Gammaproteobacteria bacterium]
MVATDARLALLHDWLTRELRLPLERLVPASSDASFRRYFRASCGPKSYIVMDAPPAQEDVRPYLKVSGLLEPLGVHVPHVYERDVARGLLLLEDLGTTLYLERLTAGDDPEPLYAAAFKALLTIQVAGRAAAAELGPYDARELQREMRLMPEWFLARHLDVSPDAAEVALLERTFAFLVEAALEQPQVLVHRDYHSRNLMVLPARSPGVIDFQDAVRGALGYDLVSLLKDCYIEWPRARIERWVAGYGAQLRARGALSAAESARLLRWVDLAGVQRHIKVLGIFCRLWYRDGKAGYLPDLPRTLGYVQDACARYPELAEFGAFLGRRVGGRLAAANAAAARRA